MSGPATRHSGEYAAQRRGGDPAREPLAHPGGTEDSRRPSPRSSGRLLGDVARANPSTPDGTVARLVLRTCTVPAKPRWLLAISERRQSAREPRPEPARRGTVQRRRRRPAARSGAELQAAPRGCRARTARRSRATGRFLEGGPPRVATDRGDDEGCPTAECGTPSRFSRSRTVGTSAGSWRAGRHRLQPRPRGRDAASAVVTVAGSVDSRPSAARSG